VYHELLQGAAVADVAKAVSADTMQAEMVVQSTAEGSLLCGTLGLPLARDTQLPYTYTPHTDVQPSLQPLSTAASAQQQQQLPPPPFRVPYTPLVPALLRTIRSYVQDSASYLRGLLPPWELETAVTLHRDRLVAVLVLEQLTPRINTLCTQGRLEESMRAVSATWALSVAGSSLASHTSHVSAPLAEQDPQVARWTAAAAVAAAAEQADMQLPDNGNSAAPLTHTPGGVSSARYVTDVTPYGISQ
jgi:hypothetical protein